MKFYYILKTECVPGYEEIVKAKGNGRLMIRSVCLNCTVLQNVALSKTTQKEVY